MPQTDNKKPSQIKSKDKPSPSFLEKWESSDTTFLRVLYKIASSIWMVVMGVGMFLAWFIALLAT